MTWVDCFVCMLCVCCLLFVSFDIVGVTYYDYGLTHNPRWRIWMMLLDVVTNGVVVDVVNNDAHLL